MTTISNVSRGTGSGLPQALRTAQEAIHLPEVQEMLRRLAEHNLGVFMPHMHGEGSGELKPLPDHLMQVESGLEVSFQSAEGQANLTDRFLPVGWFWRGGAPAPVVACEMVWQDGQGNAERRLKHKHK